MPQSPHLTLGLVLALTGCAGNVAAPARPPVAPASMAASHGPLVLEGPTPASDARECSVWDRAMGPVSAALSIPGRPTIACRLGGSPVSELEARARAAVAGCLSASRWIGALRVTFRVEPSGLASRVAVEAGAELTVEAARCARRLARVAIRPPGCRLEQTIEIVRLGLAE